MRDGRPDPGSLRQRPCSTCVGQGCTILVTNANGVPSEPDHGLWVHETRLLATYEWKIDGASLVPAGAAALEGDAWLGYFLHALPRLPIAPRGRPTQRFLELRSSRRVRGELSEEVELTNHTQDEVTLTLSLDVAADFADPQERKHPHPRGRSSRTGREAAERLFELIFRNEAEHAYDHQGDRGVAHIDRALVGRIHHDPGAAQDTGEHLVFAIRLSPHDSWCARLTWTPRFEPGALQDHAVAERQPMEVPAPTLLADATDLGSPVLDPSLTSTVVTAFRQAKRDLASLAIGHPERTSRGWTLAGGWPTYTAFFGRDALASSWQSALVSTDLMRGTLAELASWQATSVDSWRDAQPGRMLHELHTGPRAALRCGPHGRYYGDYFASVYYPVAVAALWHWTGDLEVVRPYLEPARKALAWADHYGDLDGDGLYEYATTSEQGERNQGWKDSEDAIVYPDGTVVPTPLGTCEMQAFAYVAKLAMSELLFWGGELDDARRLYGEAHDLKTRFNDRFWMDREQYVAMALDPDKNQVQSIASDPGHCLASGILDEERVRPVAERLMSAELFSGWGVRTLSARHPAYDPFAYHRGTVWPVENAVFALGFARYGLVDRMHALCRAQFEAAELFAGCRLPETFAGHPRDRQHPFPALYPDSNWPQAWSASAVFCMVQAMIGAVAYAPLHALLLDPHLPEWLPRLDVRNLRVGKAVVDLSFCRSREGRTDFTVLDKRGTLHVVRQPSPQSLTAGWAERVRDVIGSLLRR